MKCGINWARLATSEGEDDEWYDHCPSCGTDAFLEAAKPGDVFYFDPIDGQVRDEKGVFLLKELPPLPPIPQWFRSFDQEEYSANKARAELAEDKAIEAYMATLSSGEDKAQKAYHEILKHNYLKTL